MVSQQQLIIHISFFDQLQDIIRQMKNTLHSHQDSRSAIRSDRQLNSEFRELVPPQRSFGHQYLEQQKQATPDIEPASVELDVILVDRQSRPQLTKTKSRVRPGEMSEAIKQNLFLMLIRKLYIDKFVSNLMRNSYTVKVKSLPKRIRNLLQDNIYEGERPTHIFNVHGTTAQTKSDLTQPLLPQSRTLLYWGYVQIVSMMFLLFHIPLCIAFQLQEDLSTKFTLFTILIAGIVVKFNVAFIHRGTLQSYIEGTIISDRMLITQRYLSSDFIIDCSTVVLLAIYYFVLFHRVLSIDIILAIVMFGAFFKKISAIQDQVQEYFNLQGTIGDFLGLMQMIVVILLIAHIIACIWHAVGVFNHNDPTWVLLYELDGMDFPTRYNISFYWATMTMTTVGYGDILPQNNIERTVASLVMFTSGGVLSFIVNNIGTMLQNMNKTDILYRRTLSLINDFMMRNDVRFELQLRVRSYLQYIYQEQSSAKEQDVDEVLDQLNSALKDELIFQIKGNYLKQCRVLAKFSDQFLKKLTYEMKDVGFSPEEPIITVLMMFRCEDTDQQNHSLYIIIRGEMMVSHQNKPKCSHVDKQVIATLQKGESFGEWSFFSGLPPDENIYSVGFSKLYQIPRESFLQLIQDFPKDYELYCSIKDHLHFEQSLEVIDKRCYACDRRTHRVKHCPYLHFNPDRERVLKKYTFPVTQERGLKVLKRRPSIKRRRNIRTVQQSVQIFRSKIEDEESEHESSEDERFDGVDEPMDNFIQFKSKHRESSFEVYQNPELIEEDGLRSPTSYQMPSKKAFDVQSKKQTQFYIARQQGYKATYISSSPKDDLTNGVRESQAGTNRGTQVGPRQSLARYDLQKQTILTQPAVAPPKELIFDRMNHFTIYYPRYNFEAAIQRVNKASKRNTHHLHHLHHSKTSPYTLSYYVARKAIKYRYSRDVSLLGDPHRVSNPKNKMKKSRRHGSRTRQV